MTMRAFPTRGTQDRPALPSPIQIRMDLFNVYYNSLYNLTSLYTGSSWTRRAKADMVRARGQYSECREERHRIVQHIYHHPSRACTNTLQPSLACSFQHLSSQPTPDDLRAPKNSHLFSTSHPRPPEPIHNRVDTNCKANKNSATNNRNTVGRMEREINEKTRAAMH
jgi:hypothetical protein